MSKSSGKSARKKDKKKQAKKKAQLAAQAERLALPAPAMATDLPDHAILAAPQGSLPQALGLARAQWEHGDWAALTAMDAASLTNDPDRANLALILAAAHSHAGEMDRAGALAAQAIGWGASRTMAARVLLSAAQNSLGARGGGAAGRPHSAFRGRDPSGSTQCRRPPARA